MAKRGVVPKPGFEEAEEVFWRDGRGASLEVGFEESSKVA